MLEQRPCCAAATARIITKLTVRDGFQVGILNLESIVKEVADMKLVDTVTIKKELLQRVKMQNYVAPSADYEY